eukprot:g52194.t1
MDQLFLCSDQLKPLLVQSLDKNGNSLWVECPVLTYQQMRKEVVDSPAFTRSPATSDDLREEFVRLYRSQSLEKFGRLNRKRSKIHSAIVFRKTSLHSTKPVSFATRSVPRGVTCSATLAGSFNLLSYNSKES